jgi:hypothetical protein
VAIHILYYQKPRKGHRKSLYPKEMVEDHEKDASSGTQSRKIIHALNLH